MTFPIPFNAFIIICIPINFVAYAIDYDKQHLTDCAPFKCGNISEIGYPFRLLGESDYCGHPCFEVECAQPFGPDAYLYITMESVKYKVNSISWEKQRLSITRPDLSLGLCPDSEHFDTVLNHSLFDYVPGSENATLYYDCEEAWYKDPYRFSCDKNATRYGYLFFYKPQFHKKQLQLSKNCSQNITVPLLERPLPQPYRPGLVTDDIFVALGKGFEITWKVDMHQCRSCNISGGRCGHNTTTKEFNCFCHEGVYPKECPSKVDMRRCSSCNISGGRCGHNTTTKEFNCFCPEGVHPKECPSKGDMQQCGSCRCGKNSTTQEFMCFCPEGVHPKECPQLGSKVLQKVIIGVGVGVGGLVLVVAAFFYFYQCQNRRKYASPSYMRKSSSDHSPRIDYEKDGYCDLPIFDYEELKEATNDFDQKKKVGDGGFGTIYKGKLRDGRVVAIKRLYESNDKTKEQFLNEVEILARLRHPHLVILYGFTSPYSERLLLVYEFISNGTVADHLHGDQAKPGSLSWSTRLSIAIKTATALLYLHQSDVIHRDVKTSNILLNDNFSVKVADFGLSRLFPFNVTHVLTAPQGTPGYMDPEYHQCFQLTEKSDVYSFGVVLIELISSLPAVDITRDRHEIHLSIMAINKIQSGALDELVDKHLGFDCNDNIRIMISAVAELAFRCLQHVKEMRPCMEEVLETLTSIQKLDKPTNKATEMDSLLDDAVLLKSQLIHSPCSVMVKLDSTSTTSNASG